MHIQYLIPILLFMLICSSPLPAAQKPAGNEALAGRDTARVIFDIRLADIDSLILIDDSRQNL